LLHLIISDPVTPFPTISLQNVAPPHNKNAIRRFRYRQSFVQPENVARIGRLAARPSTFIPMEKSVV
jgi:hypothetical protein